MLETCTIVLAAVVTLVDTGTTASAPKRRGTLSCRVAEVWVARA